MKESLPAHTAVAAASSCGGMIDTFKWEEQRNDAFTDEFLNIFFSLLSLTNRCGYLSFTLILNTSQWGWPDEQLYKN